jgi:tetratricopeptide (TPR) repeat protein
VKAIALLLFSFLFLSCTQTPTQSDVEKADYLYNQTIPYYLNGDLDSAEKGFLAVAEKYPFYTSAQIMLGKTYFFKNDFVKAKKYLDMAIEHDPNVIAYIWLAKIAMIDKKMDDALTLLHKALNLDHSHPLTHYELAKFYRATQQFDKAIYHYNFSISYEDMYSDMRFDLATLYFDLGLIDQAKKMLQVLLNTPFVSDKMKQKVDVMLKNMEK